MQVKATARGFDGTTIREVGEVFDMPDTTPKKDERGKVVGQIPTTGSWFEPVKAKKGDKAAEDEKLA